MKKQTGGTTIGLLFKLLGVFFVAVVIIRVIPVYYQYFAVVNTVKSLSSNSATSLTGNAMTDIAELRSSITKRMDINSLDDLKPKELSIEFVGPNHFKIHLNYQVVKPLVYNVSLLFHFDKFIEVHVGSEN